ncbi:transcription factor TFIIIB component B'' homolog isoform X3 [Bufo gargarizans]|uniref:transcription factor TFIIIB component B'' homolog isoform X3 n=1 Tax=Bufo gargarizans TaxID=30331 RepID=UPI001CF52582|nr:transcription factor TFIIIB component B'' homolog isoform X3 [Bufo gargarizans]
MIRRARLSFKPNVRPSGRAAGQGSAGGGQDGGGALPAEPLPDPGKDTRAEGGTGAPVTEEPVLPPPKEESKAEPVESAATVSDETPPSKTPSAPLQRRKRISTLPNLAKPRVSNSASDVVLKVSQADVPSMPPVTPALCRSEGPEKGKVVSSQKPPVPLSPPQGQHVSLPEKRTPVPQVPQFSPYKKSVLKPQDISTAKPVEGPQKEEPSPLKERPSQKSCTNEVYEVVKPVRKTITSNLERERLRRAQKLRDLLKAELHKERKAWRVKHPIINPLEELEKSKMTMRDFIHFIPMSNPMSSSLEESPSPEKSFPVESPVSGLGGKDSVEDDLDEDEEADDSQMLAPRVKVAEDGSIILDEESLTVEVSRNKAPIVEGNDPIFERGSTTTYSCFRKTNYSKPWSNQETDMFFLAISMVGTDFSMIGQLFPHRERIEIKNKFKKEERVNGWRIDKAFREKRDFDFEFFAALLDKALEAGKKKKTRSQQPRKTNAKPRKKQKGKAAAEQSLCDEDSIISEEEGADARTAEKENNRSLDVDECSAVAEPAAVKNKRAKRKKDHAKEPDEENQESQDDDVTQMPKKKSKSKITARDTDNRPELQSVDGDGNLKEPLAEKKTRVQQNKPNYKESELDDDEDDADLDITEEFEPDDVDLPCKAGEADVSSQSVAVTCEEETSLVLFTEESDCQSGLEDLSGLLHSLSEVKDAASQPSDVSLVGEAEPMIDVPQEETSLPACKTVDSPDAGSGQVDEQDSEHKDKQKVPQGRRVRPAPNLSRASVKKVSAEEQSDTKQQTERSDDVEVGKSDEKIVQEGVLSVDPLMETDKAANLGEEPNTPLKPSVLLKGRFQRPRPNLGRAAAKRDRLTSPEEPKNMPEGEACVESASEPDDTTSNIPVKEAEPKPLLAKSNMGSSITEEVSMTLEKHDDGGFHGTSVDSNPTMAGKEESASDDKKETSKPILTKGRFQKPKPNLNKSVTRSPVTAPPEPPVQKEEKKPGATSTDHTDPNMSVDVAVLSDGDADMTSTVEDTFDKSLAQIGKEESSSDDKKETSKPILTKGRFQKPKPNLNKSVTRSAVTAPPEPPVQKEEKKTGATSTDHTDPNMSMDVAVLSDGDAEMKSTVEDTCGKAFVKSIALSEEAISDAKQGEAEALKPVRTRFPKPSPNLVRAAMRKETAATEPKTPEKGQGTTKVSEKNPELLKTEDILDPSIAGHGGKETEHGTEEKSAAIKPAQLKRGRLIRPVPNFVKQSPKTLSSSQSKTNEDVNGGAPALKDKEHVVATSSPAGKRKDSDCNVDVSPKRLCPSGTPQKPSCLPDSEVDQASLTSEPQSSGQASIVQDTATPQRSKFGRSLKKLSTAPASASPKSENSSDCPEKEKAARNVKSSTTKISKPVPGKSKGKTTLVKIRATRQEEDDDEEDADPGFEEESYDLAPDMQNQAPVFVPFSLRSPKPVPAEIEETVEELEILVDAVDLPSASLDLGETPFQHVVDPQAQPDKKGQYDGSAEAAMTLISMGSSVYKTNIKELLSPDPCRENDISSPGRRSSQEPHTGLKLLLSPSRNFPSSPSRDAGAMESSITVDTRTVEDSHSDPNLENKTETNVTRSDFGSAENLPNPINDNLTFPVEQISYPVAQQDFNSPEVGASDGLLEGHDTGEEATFILTLVEIPMNDDYAYSCDSSMAESLPAPVLISSGSSQVLTQDLNPSLETVHGSSETIGQEDKDPMFRESSGNRSAQCMDGEDHPPLQEKPLDSEQVVDLEIKATACEVDGDGKSAPELSVPEPKPEEPAEATQISATPVTERPPNWPVPKPSATVPVEMPGTSSESLNRNLPLVYANSVTTSKTTLKRPGKKPLGFLPLVCKEKQAKKANVENKKKKNLPTPKYRKKSPKVHSPQKGSPDVNVENDSEVPSSSSSSSAEMESAASQNALLSISQITDNQDTELESPYKSPDVATEEEAASVSEYFFSDIFMEVDD